MEKATQSLKNPLTWLYGLAVVIACTHILLTRNGSNAIDFYNFWMVPQIVRDLKTSDIYERDNQPIFGEYYFKKYYDSPEAPGDRASYSPLRDDPNYNLRKDFMSTNGRFFNFTDPMKEQSLLQGVAAFRRVFPDLTGTPFLYTFAAMFQSGDFERDYTLFRVFGLLGTVAALLICGGLMGLSRVQSYFLSVAFLVLYYPIRLNAVVGNSVEAQLGLLALSLWCYRHGKAWSLGLCGLLIAVTVLIKPSTLFVLPCLTVYWLSRKDWETWLNVMLGALIGFVSCILATRILFGSLHPWARWYELVFKKILHRDDYLSEMTNYSPGQYIFELFGGNMFLVSIVLTGLTLLLIVFPILRSRAAGKADVQNVYWIVTMSCAAMMISSKLVWQFYQVMYIPLFIGLFKIYCDRGEERERWAGLFTLFLIFLVMCFDGQDWRFRLMSGMYQAGVNVTAAAVLFGLGVLALVRQLKAGDGDA